MWKVKNFIFGQGRLSRRQYSVMAFWSTFFYFIFHKTVWFLMLGGEFESILPAIYIVDFILIFTLFLINIGYTNRRGSDFWLNPIFSIMFVLLITFRLMVTSNFLALLFFWGYFYGGVFNNTILIVYFIFSSVYVFCPSVKGKNKFWDMPPDTGSPKRIITYMATGNWNTTPKL